MAIAGFQTNLFAYTTSEGDSFPEYISINAVDDEVIITVRSGESHGRCGPTAAISLLRKQFDQLMEKTAVELRRMDARG